MWRSPTESLRKTFYATRLGVQVAFVVSGPAGSDTAEEIAPTVGFGRQVSRQRKGRLRGRGPGTDLPRAMFHHRHSAL